MRAVADVIAKFADELKFIDLDAILEDLNAEGIIEHHEFIEVIPQPIKTKLLLLRETLPRRGDHAFPAFLKCLRRRRHLQLADRMEQEKNPVQALKELCEKNSWNPPEYTDVKESGEPHNRMFLVKVVANKKTYQPSQPSKSKKEARTAAASLCLKRLGFAWD
ncbi:unnamed protein product [Darwinula stevensoni]|uniref:DRBM domain-containing protein n=1 Tax=Darwinula stevensoni TaxID=69355 RepID=A0A7R8XIW5_9CRUS|nr:unnamed protein product [Darwinula stevensoni]CAG0893832.1 unnamed protein product [Darwinula stevensoni]